MTDQVNSQEGQSGLFNGQEQAQSSTTTTPVVETPDLNTVFNDKLSAITDGEGKPKYKDIATALEALKHSQQHIATLEEENSRFQRELTERETLERAQANLSAQQEGTTNPEGMSADQIAEIAMKTFAQKEQENIAKANAAKVVDTLVSKYGDMSKAQEAFSSKAKALGLSIEEMDSLAKRSPQAVLAYFDAKAESSPAPSKGTINTSADLAMAKEEENLMARYMGTNNSAISKWREAAASIKI
jgi:hypothetical protein